MLPYHSEHKLWEFAWKALNIQSHKSEPGAFLIDQTTIDHFSLVIVRPRVPESIGIAISEIRALEPNYGTHCAVIRAGTILQ